MQAGSGPLKWKIPANLKYNFSKEYLEEVVDGKKTRMEVKDSSAVTLDVCDIITLMILAICFDSMWLSFSHNMCNVTKA